MIRAAIVGAACWAVAAGAGAQDLPISSKLAEWYATGPLDPDGSRHGAARDDFHTGWVVSTQDGRAQVRPMWRKPPEPTPLPFEIKQADGEHHFAGFRQSIRVADGWVVSFNHGHYGGEIWWFAPDGKQRYLIERELIVGFLATKAGIDLPMGSADGFDDGGRIARLVRGPDGKWSLPTVRRLSSAPGAAIVEAGGTLLVATGRQLLRIDPSTGKATILIDDAPWRWLHPNSIAVEPSGRIFVGMQHGVTRIERVGETYATNWLLPCRTFDTNLRPPGLH